MNFKMEKSNSLSSRELSPKILFQISQKYRREFRNNQSWLFRDDTKICTIFPSKIGSVFNWMQKCQFEIQLHESRVKCTCNAIFLSRGKHTKHFSFCCLLRPRLSHYDQQSFVVFILCSLLWESEQDSDGLRTRERERERQSESCARELVRLIVTEGN